MVGSRFVRAVDLAGEWHGDQRRKGTKIPYISHLLAVASLVLEARGDESLAIAALLHDSIEDVGVSQVRIEREFGSRVARIVKACSDGTPNTKRTAKNWKKRKRAYLRKLETAHRDALLVSCADKLHNARSILLDLRREGDALWNRFNQKDPAMQRWYYESLAEVFGRRIRKPKWLPEELTRTVQEIFL
ncbi:MAG TPA: HD domain-containing protein [Gemmatimonadota bacterium]|nr:HD domain-containing protein [Gemmatimonadota bacterium]